MILALIVIWGAVTLYLLWVHVMAAFSNPPVPSRETVMPSMMAVLIGAGMSAAVILTSAP
jgi:Na+/proline symporter